MGLATWIGTGGELLERLRAAGVPPEDVGTVMFTHLHPDHVGWNLRGGGQYRPTLPRALTPLEALGALDLIDGEHSLTSEVTAIHTPGSMSLLITSGDERALVTGDSIVHPTQVELPDLAFSFDHDLFRPRRRNGGTDSEAAGGPRRGGGADSERLPLPGPGLRARSAAGGPPVLESPVASLS
jgi:glyoxylase-like metal-dependent hydrolase (beta-lactamase superfamily II)